MRVATLAIVLVCGWAAAARAGGSSIVVTVGDDNTTDNGDCSLREAIEAANTQSAVDDCAAGVGSDDILVDATLFPSITLTSSITLSSSMRVLAQDGNVVIDGGGAAPLITTDDAITFTGFTFQNFHANGPGGPLIFNVASGSLSLSHVTLRENTAHATSGSSSLLSANASLVSLGSVVVRDNDLEDADALPAGALFFLSNASFVSDSVFAGNRAARVFSMFAGSSVVDRNVDRSAFINNTVSDVIFISSSPLNIKTCTFAGNTGPAVTSLSSTTSVDISNSTLVASGADASIIALNGATVLRVLGSIVTGTSVCNASSASLGFNVLNSTASCIAQTDDDQVDVDPLLAPLAVNDNVPSLIPLANSPAIDAGSCTDADGNMPLFDVRGEARPANNCDAGSVERVATDPAEGEGEGEGSAEGEGEGEGSAEGEGEGAAAEGEGEGSAEGEGEGAAAEGEGEGDGTDDADATDDADEGCSCGGGPAPFASFVVFALMLRRRRGATRPATTEISR